MDYWWFVRSEEKSILPALCLVIYALLTVPGQVIEDCADDGRFCIRDQTVMEGQTVVDIILMHQ